MYALWEQSTGEGMGTNLMFARSLRFGHSWDEPLRVTDKETPSTNAFSSMAVSPRGDVYAVWLDGRDRKMGPPGTSAVYLAKSADRGATFGRNVRVATGVCPCCRPTLGFGAAGEVHVSWRHVFPGHIRDMVVATSSDGAATFSEPVRVAEDGWKINGCPHSGASMLGKGNRLYITWYSDGDGSNPGIRLAWSDDGAKSFSQPGIVSRDILDANHPALALAGDERLLLTFQGRDPVKKSGWNPAGPYLVEISHEGQADAPPCPLVTRSRRFGGSIEAIVVNEENVDFRCTAQRNRFLSRIERNGLSLLEEAIPEGIEVGGALHGDWITIVESGVV